LADNDTKGAIRREQPALPLVVNQAALEQMGGKEAKDGEKAA